MTRDDDPTRLGRYRDPQTGREFFSGRVGRHDGRPARPFHGELPNIRRNQGGAARGRAGLEYIDRAERYEDRADELEAAGGYCSREELAAALEAVEASSIRKDAIVVRKAHIELPADSTAEQRRITAQALADWFEERGHPTRWAIHASPQPHVHLIATARAAWKDRDGTWQAEPQGKKGLPGKRILAGPVEIRRWRAAVAAIINDTCEPAVEFHPGRLADVGIDRPAKVRLPAAEYWRRTHGSTSTRRRANERIEAEEYSAVQAERRAWAAVRQAKQRNAKAEEQERRQEKAKRLIAGDDRRTPLDVQVLSTRQVQQIRDAAQPRPLPPLSDKQLAWLVDSHKAVGLTLPDLATHQGRSEAFGTAKAVEALKQQALTLRAARQGLAASPAPSPPDEPEPPRGPPTSPRRPFRGRGIG